MHRAAGVAWGTTTLISASSAFCVTHVPGVGPVAGVVLRNGTSGVGSVGPECVSLQDTPNNTAATPTAVRAAAERKRRRKGGSRHRATEAREPDRSASRSGQY